MKAFLIAFSMYSRLPMPRVEWDDRGMRHALCFFPIVGVAVGAGFVLWHLFCVWLNIGALLRAAGLCVLPLAISGGIHMDGFVDTSDALASHQSSEKKLEILKDSHTGAFAIITCGAYWLLQAGAYAEAATASMVWTVALGFVLSRALCALMLLHTRSARHNGLLYTFTSVADKGMVTGSAALEAVLAFGAMLWVNLFYAVAAGIACVLFGLWHRHRIIKQFGGVTGDLAGFFVQGCELCMALAIAVAAKLPL